MLAESAQAQAENRRWTKKMSVRRPSIAAALSAAFAACAVYLAALLVTEPGGRSGSLVDVWLYNALIVGAAAIATSRPLLVARDRLAWSVIALALWCTAFGELYTAAAAPKGYPSLADAAWLAFYPLVYVGIVLLVRRRGRFVAGTLWLDGLMASITAAALGSALLVEVVLRTNQGSHSAIATNLAYPLGDVLLLSAVFGIFSLAGWKVERRWLILGLGLLATAIADAVYLFQVDTYRQGGALDVLWPLSMLLIAASAWVSARNERALDVDGRPLLAVPVTCALASIGILVVDHFDRLNPLAIALAAISLLLVVVRLVVTFRENSQLFAITHREAVTDSLTGLGNRRRLVADLEDVFEAPGDGGTLLMILDLDGFKGYNDSFGHPAGDALLARLAEKLAEVPGPKGGAYRMGGDEFCVVARVAPGEAEAIIDRACLALTEHGEGFDVTCSFGAVILPDEAADASQALGLADERLYAQKRGRRGDSDRAMHTFLVALAHREHDSELGGDGVAELALEVGHRLGLAADEVHDLDRAARLHDLGQLAVPDEILAKPAPLTEPEWEFIHRHTVVGERILRAWPGYEEVARVVRASHENWDGSGYPDGLAGEEIPLAARIVRVADSFIAMSSRRPFRSALSTEDALAELTRCAGAQFDPTVARVLVAHVREKLEAGRRV